MENILHILGFAVLAPLLPGVVNQTKAFFAGKRGPGVFRLYCDLAKLTRKRAPRPAGSGWAFAAAAPATLGATLAACAFFPWTAGAPEVAAPLFFYLLGAGRFAMVLGALDAGNAFEGMGASREVQFSALVEPTVFIVLGFLAMTSGSATFGEMLAGAPAGVGAGRPVPVLLAGLACFAVMLSECSRVPFDDPETHLELTMIHEAMLLDTGGPDLAYMLYAGALKFGLLAAFLVGVALPRGCEGAAKVLALGGGVLAVGVAVGVVESVMARMRFTKTPQALLGAALLAALAVVFLR